MKKTMKHLKKWWRVPLLLLVCLFVGSGNLLAFQETYNESINEIYFTDSRFTDVTVRPNATTPYYEMAMVYYDWSTNHNCFWKSAPQIWVDGVKVCDGTKVGSFYDEGWGAGQDACDAAYNTNYDLADNNNNWWQYSQYTDSNTGIVYTVCFHSPWESNTKSNYRIFSCKMRVYISSMEANSQHKVTIKGTWCYNVKLGHAEKTVDVNKSWTFDAPNPFGNATPTKAEMTGYNTVKVKGDLNGNTGPTKVAIKSSEGAAPTVTNDHRSHNYMDPGSVTPYDKGVTSYSGLTGTYNRQDESQYNGSALGVEYVQTLVNHNVTTNYYKWYSVDVPGFAKATDLSAVDNKWTKSIVLKWNADDANGRSKEGKWYVYRGNDMIASDINYGSGLRDYTDQSDTLTYEVGYDYTVAFVPKDTPTGMRISSLETTINGVTISRNWSFKEEKATLVDNDTHINISWTHSPIDDATGSNRYTINLFRSDDGGATWNNIKQHEISSNSITEGSYKDETGLHPNKTYIYQLRINLLGTEIKSKFINIKLGGSQLTGFTASRGEFNNVVKLAWTVRQVGDEETTFTIDRRPLGTEGEQTGWANIHTVAGTNSSYSYDDVNALPGAYNEYRLAIVDKDDHDSIQTYLTTDGFTYSTGVISGTVTYGTGSAVQDVKVKLKQQTADGGLSSAGMHSLQFRDYGAGVAYHTDNEEIKQLFGGDFTAQMWVKPLKEEMGVSNENYIIFDAYYVFTAILHYNKSDNTYSAGAWLDGANSISNIRIPSNEWSHITVTHKVLSTDSATTNIIVATGDTIMKAQVCGKSVVNWTENALMSDAIAVGNGGQMTDKRNYRGYMDEIRFFTRALSEEEVLRNYNHPLVGNENGLAIYYPFDEGLAKQNVAYDYSKTNGVANGRHAMSKIPAFSSTNVPPENMLCMMNYTDSLGNYTIRGIHFQGDGTAYSVIPEYNGHDFSPLAKSCFVSQSSLVHSGIDFEDVSSFPVSGTIYYAGTTYPARGRDLLR